MPIENARWIWTRDNPGEAHVWIYARRSFNVASPTGAELDITADLRYFLWINGAPVGFGPPKFHDATPTFDRYAIADLLRPGRNTVAVQVYSYGAGNDLSSCMPRRGALRVSLRCDGVEIVSDRGWKVRREAAYAARTVRRGEMQPPAESFDASNSLGLPWLPDYDDSRFEAATELPELVPAPRFELRDIPLFSWRAHEPDRVIATGRAEFAAPLELTDMAHDAATIAAARRGADSEGLVRVERGLGGRADTVLMDAARLGPTQGCYALFDFGRIWTGYPVVELSGTPGTVVHLSYAEHLREGRLDPTKHGLHYVDRLMLGKEKLRHRITWPKCLRYLQVDARGGSLRLEALALERSSYPVERRGGFACSDPVLNQAVEISAHTVQLCMEDGYMDTPWRERGSWLGDDIVKALANFYLFGDRDLFRRFLRQHARGQLPSGAMQGKYPGCKSSHISTWTLSFAISLKEYTLHTGDDSLAGELWPVVKKTTAWLEGYRLEPGVYGNLPLQVTSETNIYNFIDWAPVDTLGANAAWNAHAYHFLQAAGFLAGVAGDGVSAQLCRERAAALGDAFRRVFFDHERGVFVNGWQDGRRKERWGCHENYLAILFGLADPGQRRSILERFRAEDLRATFVPERAAYEDLIPEFGDAGWSVAIALSRYPWDARRMVPLGSPYFANFALQALCELGMADEAQDLISQRWGDFSRAGGTTVFETWSELGSLSHGWGCAPALICGRYFLGAAPARERGFDYTITPQRGSLTWAQGRIPTPQGILEISWKFSGKWRLEILLPGTLRARAGLPLADGEHLLLNGTQVPAASVEERYGRRYGLVLLAPGGHVLESAGGG